MVRAGLAWSGPGLVWSWSWSWSGFGLALVWPWSGPGLALGLELGRHSKQIPMRPTIRCASCTLCDYAGPDGATCESSIYIYTHIERYA